MKIFSKILCGFFICGVLLLCVCGCTEIPSPETGNTTTPIVTTTTKATTKMTTTTTTAEKTTEDITYEQTEVEYPTDTEPVAEKGCGGMISLSVLALIPAAVLIIKKKED